MGRVEVREVAARLKMLRIRIFRSVQWMSWRSFRRVGFLALTAIVLSYLLSLALVVAFQEQMVFVGSGNLPALPSPPEGWTEVRLENDVGESVAWYRPPSGAHPGPAVIAMHGNGESIEHWPSVTQPWVDRGYAVLLPEIRGYAGVDGPTTSDGVTSDMLAWRDWLDSRAEIDPSVVVYHGYSLGGGIMAKLAAERPPAAMVLQSTFTDLPSLAPVPTPASLATEPYETASTVDGWTIPTVVVHGRADRVIPFEHGVELARRSGGDFVEHEGGHVWPSDRKPMWDAIDTALDEVTP